MFVYALCFFMKNRNPSIITTPMGRAMSPGAPAKANMPAMRYVMPAITAQEMA